MSHQFAPFLKKANIVITSIVTMMIYSDDLLAIDKQQVSAVVLLDLSAAFDTVDHKILLTRLSNFFGIKGSALDLLSSYLQPVKLMQQR